MIETPKVTHQKLIITTIAIEHLITIAHCQKDLTHHPHQTLTVEVAQVPDLAEAFQDHQEIK